MSDPQSQSTDAAKALPPNLMQDGADLYDRRNNRVAWFSAIDPRTVWVEGNRTAAELRAIADWMESQ